MPATTVTCPFCNTTLKPKSPVPGGTRIKCPKCNTIFVVKADDAEEVPPTVAAPPKPAAPKPAAPKPAAPRPAAPRPAAPRPKPAPAAEEMLEATEIIDDEAEEGRPAARPKKKGVPLWVWLTAGGVGLLLLCGCCGIGGWIVSSMMGGAVSMGNFDKIKMGASESDVTAILGPPTQRQSAEDIAKALGAKLPKGAPDSKALIWKGSGEDVITVDFVSNKVVAKSCKIGATTKVEGNLPAGLGGP